MSEFDYLQFLPKVCDEDIRFIKEREKKYKASWKKSGGRSGWFMIARKIDRLQEMMKFNIPETSSGTTDRMLRQLEAAMSADDIFKKIEQDPSGRDATVLSEIRDLRRYLCMVEAEMVCRGVVKDLPTENGYKVNKFGKLEDVNYEIQPLD